MMKSKKHLKTKKTPYLHPKNTQKTPYFFNITYYIYYIYIILGCLYTYTNNIYTRAHTCAHTQENCFLFLIFSLKKHLFDYIVNYINNIKDLNKGVFRVFKVFFSIFRVCF